MSRIELAAVRKQYALDSAATMRSFGRLLLGRDPAAGGRGVKVALDDLSLVIEAGERVGILGPNGAGKSTLLQLIAGISQADAGTIRVEGHVTSVLTLGVGIQDEATGRANVFLDGELQGKSRAEVVKVLDKIIDFADLGEFIDRPVRTYSTGMKARLAFAMVSHLDPDILLIDEALSVGDADFSAKASRRIREICARGNIVVVVSHSLAAINEICSRCLWLDNGRIVMDGPPAEVTRAYQDAVRQRDEQELAQRFSQMFAASERLPGYSIAGLELRSASHAGLRAGAPLTVRIATRLPEEGPPPALRLWIERLDGLLLVDETVPARELEMEADLPGVLAAGIYKLAVELLVSGEVAATRSHLFEIAAESVPSGGRPALVSPYSLEVEALIG